MTLGIAIYGIEEPAAAMIEIVESMGRYLGLKREPVRLWEIDDLFEDSTEIPISSVAQNGHFLPENYSIGISDIGDDEYVLRNTGASVSYAKSKYPGTLTAHTNSLDLSAFLSDPVHRNILAPAKGTYGFILDWKSKSSFWAFAGGFVEFKPNSEGGTADTPAGLWGVEHRVHPESSVDGKFRDIYEVNLISDKHLRSGIHGATLRELLRNANNGYGRLERLADDWYEWVVPCDRISRVRNEFLSAGLLNPNFVDPSI